MLDGFPRSNTVLSHLAVTLTSQLTDHYRGLAAADPAGFEPDLATALNNLGIRLSNLGRREPAPAATEEAVETYQRLAAANPAAFERALASSLWGLAWVRAAGPLELPEALTAASEAVAIYRRLADHLPGAFTGHLRGALGVMANLLDALGRHDEASELRRELDHTDDDAS